MGFMWKYRQIRLYQTNWKKIKWYVLRCDGGQDKCIVNCAIAEKDYEMEEDETLRL